MKIMVMADGRSPITRGWVKDLLESGHEVILVSSFPHQPIAGIHYSYLLPIAFARFAGGQTGQIAVKLTSSPQKSTVLKGLLKKYRGIFQKIRYWLGPLSLYWYRPFFKKLVAQHQPDLIHALRIPFEGMLAAAGDKRIPLVVSIWGNDLTLHAPQNFLMRSMTKTVLRRSCGLITDVERDIHLAGDWGYDLTRKPVMVALTSGGIDLDQMAKTGEISFDFPYPDDMPIIINPRGIRPGYVRNDTFFAAIPRLIEIWQKPVLFVCPSMLGQPEAEAWVKQYGIEQHVRLLPFLSQQELWQLFKRAAIMVSVTEHDGTPNSLLESMALGTFPIVGEIASLREWIRQGENGFLVDPGDPEALAQALLQVLANQYLRQQAAVINYQLVKQKANRAMIRQTREAFYSQILNQLDEKPSA